MDFVKSTIAAHPVVVFGKSYCPYCHKAVRYLSQTGCHFLNINLDEQDFYCRLTVRRPDGAEIQSALASLTGRRTVPNVFINQESIGGAPEEKESNSQPIITSVNDQLKSVIKQHLTDCDLTSIPVLTPYEITKYDGLFLFSIEKLKALCEKKNVKTDDCKIKYHYVSRIKCVDENFHLFEDIKLPMLSDPSLVDRYREQLLLFEGAPGIMDKNSARNSACEHLRTHSWKMPVTIGSVYYVNFVK